MKTITQLLIVGALFLGNSLRLEAQILNGSFTESANGSPSGFADWSTLGAVQEVGPGGATNAPTPPSGTTQALVQSTDADLALTISVSAATIETAFDNNGEYNVILPSSNPSSSDPYYDAVNGQAIYQTFSVSSASTLSFAYAFGTNDYAPYDSTGYILDGVYHQLVNPPNGYIPTAAPAFAYNLSYADTAPIVSINLSAGTHTFGFVAYNTGGHSDSTGLYVTDITTTPDDVPEPAEWTLIALGGASLILFRKLRSLLSSI